MSGEMKELMGSPIKIVLGNETFEVEKLTMKRQFEVFDIMTNGFASSEGTMVIKMGNTAITVLANVLGKKEEEIKGSAAEIMQALEQIWEQNEFGPLYKAVAQMNKKVVGQ